MKMKLANKIIFLSLLFFFIKFVPAQTVIISENFKNGIPKAWEVSSTNPYRTWEAKNYRDFHYVNISAFGGRNKPAVDVVSSLYTPEISDSLQACKLKFSLADAYSNGQPLSVYITDNEKNILKKIPEKHFASFINNPGKYDNRYDVTSWINLPKLEIPYKIEFRYTSNKEVSTTIQLNEVDVWCQ